MSRGLGRASKGNGVCEVVMPKARLFETRRMRLVTGYESMSLQGILFEGPDVLKAEDDSLLRNLAGNAFELHCAAAALITLLAAVASLPPRDEALQTERQGPANRDSAGLDIGALLDACAGDCP